MPDRAQPYRVNKFVGYHRHHQLEDYGAPEGSLRPDSTNFFVTNRGTLRNSPGAVRFTSATANYTRSIHWWDRSKGGGVAVLEGAGELLKATPPIGTWSSLPGNSSVTQAADRQRSAQFSSYGPWLFYSNGRDRPKKIRMQDLRCFELGLTPPTDDECPDVATTHSRESFGFTGLGIGVYQYKFAFLYKNGGVSNLSSKTLRVAIPGSTETSLSAFFNYYIVDGAVAYVRGAVDITGFPTTADYSSIREDVEAILVYRTFANGSVYYYAGSVYPGETHYLDNKPDTQLGSTAPLDNDVPPTSRLVEVYEDRAWYVGSVGEQDVLAYSLKGFPDIVPPSYYINQLQWVGGGEVTNMRANLGTLFLFLEEAVYAVGGNRPETYRLIPVNLQTGCIAQNTLRFYRGSAIFLSRGGISILTGSQVQTIALPFEYDLSELGSQIVGDSCAAIVDGYYWLSIPGLDEAHDGAALTKTVILNLNNFGVGLSDVNFDYASDTGPFGYPLITKFALNLDPEGVYVLGQDLRRGNQLHYQRSIDWRFHWMDLGSPQVPKSLDKVELDFVAHTVDHLRITIRDENSKETTRPVASSRQYPVVGTATWTTSDDFPEATTHTIEIPCSNLSSSRRFWVQIVEAAIESELPKGGTIELTEVRFYYQEEARR